MIRISDGFGLARFAGPDSAGGSLWKRPWLHVDELIHAHLRWSHDEGISSHIAGFLYPERCYPDVSSICLYICQYEVHIDWVYLENPNCQDCFDIIWEDSCEGLLGFSALICWGEHTLLLARSQMGGSPRQAWLLFLLFGLPFCTTYIIIYPLFILVCKKMLVSTVIAIAILVTLFTLLFARGPTIHSWQREMIILQIHMYCP